MNAVGELKILFSRFSEDFGMECEQREIHNQLKNEDIFIHSPEYDPVENGKEIFRVDQQIFKHNKIKEESENEGSHLSQSGIFKVETVDKGIDDDKNENKVNIQTFSSVTSEDDVFNLCRMRSSDEEDEKRYWEEIIQNFFNTNSKEDVLNLIRMNPHDKDENMDWEEIIQTFFISNSKEGVLTLLGQEESYPTSNVLEVSCIREDSYVQPHFHNKEIKKFISSTKRNMKQRIVWTKKQPANITFICDECKKEFSSWWLRRKHWIDTEHKVFEMCTACNKPYIHLQKHIYMKHSETLFICNKCGKVFTSQIDVDNHSSIHSANQNSYCFVCSKNIDELEVLKKHVKRHFNLILFMCDICEMEFVNVSMLEEHLRLFHCMCPLCNTMFHRASYLYEHYQHVHKNELLFSCESCDKNFKSKAKLNEHVKRVHLKELPFSCSECDQKFVSKPKLKNHIIVKHQQKQFECDICAKKFSFHGSLISHMKLHTEKENVEFKCMFCDTAYKRRVQMEWHLHGSSLKGFSCKECVINFGCRTKYKEHVEEHKEKNIKFHCDYCPYSNEKESVVKWHMSEKHPSEYLMTSKDSVVCQICSHLCSTKHNLCRHQRRKHGLFTRQCRMKTE